MLLQLAEKYADPMVHIWNHNVTIEGNNYILPFNKTRIQ